MNRTFGLCERGAQRRTNPAASWFDGAASDSNRILWQTTNPQLFGPHCGIRLVLDQSEAMGSSGILRNIFIWLWARDVGGLSIQKTAEKKDAANDARRKRAAESKWVRKTAPA